MNSKLKYGFTLIIICIFHGLFAQVTEVKFEARFQNEKFELDKAYYSIALGDSIIFDELKFYVSNVELCDRFDSYRSNEEYYLIDFSTSNSTSIKIATPDLFESNHLKFSIGIDSLENVSGAMGGALDPMNGMYWTWKNGYINCKLEGKSNACKSKDHSFIFHLGGYQFPFKSIRHFEAKVGSQNNYLVILDIESLIEKFNIQNASHVMSPNESAMKLSSEFIYCLSIQE